jgi:hypothetical protein
MAPAHGRSSTVGLEFIDETGGGAGVRLRKPMKAKRR